MAGGIRREPTVVVIGAGLSGLCIATRMKEAGFHDFTILEKADDVGGTWRDNRYPGLTCDIPCRYYQFTFAPNDAWTQFKAPRQEIFSYLERIADQYDLRPHLRFGWDIVSAQFEGGRWHLRARNGDETVADFVITACGFLHRPVIPDIEGLDTFEGAMFHSSRWDESVTIEGRRIAVIGSGSTGVQIVGAVQPVAGRLLHFQRTPQWIFPMPSWEYSRATRYLMRRFPKLNLLAYRAHKRTAKIAETALLQKGWQRSVINRIVHRHLRTVRDPDLRAALTPDFAPMCKRLVHSKNYYDAVQRDNVQVVIDPIERIEPAGIRTSNGHLHPVDIIVLATGFHAQAYISPMQVTGEGGRTLEELWAGTPTAYRTIGLPGFPNFFMMFGPHSPIAQQSIPEGAETQSGYIVQWLQMYRDGVFDTAAPTEDATQVFNDEVRAAYPGDNVWATGGCSSWYLAEDGVPNIWPWTADRYNEMLSAPRLEDFDLTRTEEHSFR